MKCDYCGTINSGDQHHQGLCANCGAPFGKQEERLPHIPIGGLMKGSTVTVDSGIYHSSYDANYIKLYNILHKGESHD